MDNNHTGAVTTPLTSRQASFLAHRLLSGTDREAATLIGITGKTVTVWKRQPGFAAAYGHAFDDAVSTARAHLNSLLALAAVRLGEMLDAVDKDGRPDNSARLAAAKLVLQAGGVLREHVDANLKTEKQLRIVVDDEPRFTEAQLELVRRLIVEGPLE